MNADDVLANSVSDLSDRELAEQTYLFAKGTAENIAAIRATVDSLSSEVGPTLNALMSNPMFKMILGKAGGR